MDEDEEKLEALRKKMKFEEDPSLLDNLKALWYAYHIMVKKKRTVKALEWIHFQTKLTLYWQSFYFDHFSGMPTEKDEERARKAKQNTDE